MMKVQSSKHQQYIKSLLVSSKKLVTKILVLKKLSSRELYLKVPKKKLSAELRIFSRKSIQMI